MGTRSQISSALAAAMENQSEIEDQILEDYNKLKEKCEKVINKIKVRKNKSIKPSAMK